MIASELHFTYDHWKAALLALVPLLFNFSLFIYTFFFFPHNRITRLFYSFLIILGIWQLTDFLTRTSADEATAAYWFGLLSPAIYVMPSVGLHFSLLFSQQKRWAKKQWVLFLLYAPALLFVLASYGRVIVSDLVPSDMWGWIAIPHYNTSTLLIGSCLVVYGAVTLSILARFAYRNRNSSINLRTQSRLVLFGFGVPTLVAVITEFSFPFVLHIDPVPLLSLTLSIFSVSVFVALKKYELLSYSPQWAWPSIMKNMKEGLLIVNNEDIIQFANEYFCVMCGYTEKELLGQKASELLLDPSERLRMEEKIWDRKHLVSEKYEISIRKKNGETFWCNINGAPYFDRQGNVIGSIGVHSDISERKKTESALVESESRLRNFVDESLLCIYSYEPQTKRILDANKSFIKLMGYTLHELRDMRIYDFVAHPPENVDHITREILDRKVYKAEERQWKPKDGSIIDVLVSFVYTQQRGQDVIYVAAQDITASKELEKSLNQKIRDLNIFIYQVSHDIKGPLSSILGLTNIALMETEQPAQRNYFNMIAQSTVRLDNTLNALLDVIVITQGKLKYQPIDIKQEINEIKRNLAFLPNYPKMFFNETIEIREQIVADKAMIITILQNLMANAINYADLRNESPLVNFYAHKENGHIKIVVEDNGVGIPKSVQGKIWDMFFRANELSKGTGLGLFIVRNAVERLNGNIQLHSEPGIGTRFIVTIPAHPEHVAAN
jgi:PAS domain S-box-containing protein